MLLTLGRIENWTSWRCGICGSRDGPRLSIDPRPSDIQVNWWPKTQHWRAWRSPWSVERARCSGGNVCFFFSHGEIRVVPPLVQTSWPRMCGRTRTHVHTQLSLEDEVKVDSHEIWKNLSLARKSCDSCCIGYGLKWDMKNTLHFFVHNQKYFNYELI